MKAKKLVKLIELLHDVEDFIADYEMRNYRYLTDKKIIKHFSNEKKKHVKWALRELR